MVVYGSILTILGYSGNDAIQFLLDTKVFLFLISFLFVLAIIIQHLSLRFTIAKSTKKNYSENISILKYLSYFQSLCHVFVIAFTLTLFLDILEKSDIQQKAVNLDNQLNKAVQDFYISNNRLPDSLKEITKIESHLISNYNYISDYMHYTRVNDREFEISFIGPHLNFTNVHNLTIFRPPKPYWIDEIEKQIQTFVALNCRIPFSLKELGKSLKNELNFIEILPLDQIIYTPIDSIHYTLIYTGADKKINTKDDLIENVQLTIEKK